MKGLYGPGLVYERLIYSFFQALPTPDCPRSLTRILLCEYRWLILLPSRPSHGREGARHAGRTRGTRPIVHAGVSQYPTFEVSDLYHPFFLRYLNQKASCLSIWTFGAWQRQTTRPGGKLKARNGHELGSAHARTTEEPSTDPNSC